MAPSENTALVMRSVTVMIAEDTTPVMRSVTVMIAEDTAPVQGGSGILAPYGTK